MPQIIAGSRYFVNIYLRYIDKYLTIEYTLSTSQNLEKPMTIPSQSPTYNLKAVLKKTGLKADVLRAWERRYDLPKPQRTPGGHRLYSEYDIESLKWLRARQAEGLSISHAVDLWKSTIEVGRDPLLAYSPANHLPASEGISSSGTRLESLRQDWLEASLAYDSLKADQALNQAFALYPVEMVCTEIIQKGINAIGMDWYLGKTSVQQEHFASEMANRRLETLISATPPPTRPHTVFLVCPPGERHTLSMLLLNLLLRRKGMQVVYLGADIPIDQMEETTETIKPDLIILAAQQLTTAVALRSTVTALQAQNSVLAYGGLIFNRVPQLRAHIPAYFLGETVEQAMLNIEQLVVGHPPYPAAIAGDEIYTQYREKRPLIEAVLLDNLEKYNWHREYIAAANFHFGNGLHAALEMGDLFFVEADLEWVEKLLAGRQLHTEKLTHYLTAYNQAIGAVMGEAGGPITHWIEAYIQR
jgi:DNA-binding transcriptional MerR regulator